MSKFLTVLKSVHLEEDIHKALHNWRNVPLTLVPSWHTGMCQNGLQFYCEFNYPVELEDDLRQAISDYRADIIEAYKKIGFNDVTVSFEQAGRQRIVVVNIPGVGLVYLRKVVQEYCKSLSLPIVNASQAIHPTSIAGIGTWSVTIADAGFAIAALRMNPAITVKIDDTHYTLTIPQLP